MIINDIAIKKDVCILSFGDDKQLAVSSDIVKAHNLRAGSFCDLEAIKKENEEFAAEYAEKCALKSLSVTWRTEKQLKSILYDKHIQSSGVQAALLKMKSYGYIDDERFTENYIKACMDALKGPSYIKNKLKQKGISDSILSSALLTYTYERQYQNAFDFISTKNKSLSKIPPELRKQKLYRAGAGAGYDGSCISEILSRVISDEDANKDEKDDYRSFFEPKINKKIATLKRKETDLKTIERKIRAEFYAKGAGEDIIEECLDKIRQE